VRLSHLGSGGFAEVVKRKSIMPPVKYYSKLVSISNHARHDGMYFWQAWAGIIRKSYFDGVAANNMPKVIGEHRASLATCEQNHQIETRPERLKILDIKF
jgi:hypothetical protein